MPPPFYSFNSSSTSVDFPWPEGLTGIERVALSSQGDLQRILSAFFSRPIQIAPIYTHTRITLAPDLADVPVDVPNDAAVNTASPQTPIIQTRQVLLQCADKTVCTATSTVRISSPTAARLFLLDKFPIGQMFRKLEKLPGFELLAVEFDKENGNQLWRRYRLFVDGFETEILEVFPSRDMFSKGVDWLVPSAVPATFTTCVQPQRTADSWRMMYALLAVVLNILMVVVLLASCKPLFKATVV